jgi:hypothetical protein
MSPTFTEEEIAAEIENQRTLFPHLTELAKRHSRSMPRELALEELYNRWRLGRRYDHTTVTPLGDHAQINGWLRPEPDRRGDHFGVLSLPELAELRDQIDAFLAKEIPAAKEAL